MAATWSVLAGFSVSSSQILTEVAPVAATDGLALGGGKNLVAVVPVIKAPNGQTFTGGGTLQAYYYSAQHSTWFRLPDLDEDMSQANGLSALVFPPIGINAQGNRFALIANAVTVSGGTTITVDLVAI